MVHVESRLSAIDPKLVVLLFNAAINARDLDRLTALMTDDHRFIDADNNEIKGRDAMREAWRGFFAAFPDYQNVFDSLSSTGDVVVVNGHSLCSNPALQGPALWTATVRDQLISEWRVSMPEVVP